LYVTVPRGSAATIKTTVQLEPRLIAPLTTETLTGHLLVGNGAHTFVTVPLHPLADDPAGGWWRRMIDTIRLWFA
jgi:D-alanyl-D-alanine carboxypeptidase (penicillin-binding protein 5/6)